MDERTFTEAEATKVVNAAIDRDAATKERLTLAELEEQIEALGIPAIRVRETLTDMARDELNRQKKLAVRNEIWGRRKKLALNTFKSVAIFGGAAIGVLCLLYSITFSSSRNQLTYDLSQVHASEERVYSAIGRRQVILQQVQMFSDPLNRDAEISGSENRVAVAKSNYDDAANRYNNEAQTRIAQNVLSSDHLLPHHVPLAREIWH